MRKLIPIILLILLLSLAACNSSDESSPSPENNNGQALLNTDYDNALPVSSQLIIGSLELEQTDNALDEDEAKTLLPLWQAYQTLSNSDTTAQAELDAVLKQIQEAMHPDQLQAIAGMKLTTENAQQLIQEQGLAFGRGFGGGRQGGDASGGGNFSRPGGGGLPGQPPAGGPGGLPGGGGQPDPEARATVIAQRMADANSNAFLDRFMLGALIRSLQVKTGELDSSQFGAPAPRLLTTVSEASGVPLETLQAGLEEKKSLADIITANSGDLEAARAALTDSFAARGLEGEELKQRVDDFLQ